MLQPYKTRKERGDMAEQEILKELREIRHELEYIKEHMVDPDTILTADEAKDLEAALIAFKEGRTVSLKDVKKQFGLA